MKRTPLIPRSLTAFLPALVLAGAAQAQLHPLARDPAQLATYGQSAAAMSFIASAVAGLGSCDGTLEFRDRPSDGVKILEIVCPGGEEPRFARLTFIRLKGEDGRVSLRPFRIEFLP